MKHEIVESHSSPPLGKMVNGVLTTMRIHEPQGEYEDWRIKCSCGRRWRTTTKVEADVAFEAHLPH